MTALRRRRRALGRWSLESEVTTEAPTQEAEAQADALLAEGPVGSL